MTQQEISEIMFEKLAILFYNDDNIKIDALNIPAADLTYQQLTNVEV